MKTEVLNEKQILRICNRFAFQIIENLSENEDIFLVGIKENGFEIAKIIMNEIEKISEKKVHISYIKINKKDPKNNLTSDIKKDNNFKNIFLIDDVLNTGKTLIYSITFLLKLNIKSIKTLVLIDRNHKEYPVKIDFKGISLSTNIDDNVKLIRDKKNLKAIIF